MFYRRNWIAVIVVILGLAMFIPVAQAQRQEMESIICGTSTITMVQSSPEVVIMSFDAKTIRQQTNIKLFENTTGQSVGIVKMVHGKWSWHSVSKQMAPDGEFTIWEVTGDSESGTTSRPIYGTGKFKGIKGENKGKRLTTGKPIVQGTEQWCESYKGWVELPEQASKD
jgi:hypothetical protein